jgi:uncharacterized membrane protein
MLPRIHLEARLIALLRLNPPFKRMARIVEIHNWRMRARLLVTNDTSIQTNNILGRAGRTISGAELQRDLATWRHDDERRTE